MVAALAAGLTLNDGTQLGPIHVDDSPRAAREVSEAALDRRAMRGSNHGAPGATSSRLQWVGMSLTEGKNREVRRVWKHFGFPVNRLVRLAYGPYLLGRLPVGHVEEVDAQQVLETASDGYSGGSSL